MIFIFHILKTFFWDIQISGHVFLLLKSRNPLYDNKINALLDAYISSTITRPKVVKIFSLCSECIIILVLMFRSVVVSCSFVCMLWGKDQRFTFSPTPIRLSVWQSSVGWKYSLHSVGLVHSFEVDCVSQLYFSILTLAFYSLVIALRVPHLGHSSFELCFEVRSRGSSSCHQDCFGFPRFLACLWTLESADSSQFGKNGHLNAESPSLKHDFSLHLPSSLILHSWSQFRHLAVKPLSCMANVMLVNLFSSCILLKHRNTICVISCLLCNLQSCWIHSILFLAQIVLWLFHIRHCRIQEEFSSFFPTILPFFTCHLVTL